MPRRASPVGAEPTLTYWGIGQSRRECDMLMLGIEFTRSNLEGATWLKGC